MGCISSRSGSSSGSSSGSGSDSGRSSSSSSGSGGLRPALRADDYLQLGANVPETFG
jgi:hypothetical protein